MKTPLRTVSCLFLAALLSGCFHDRILPQTAALTAVHDAYQRELTMPSAVPDPLRSERLSESGSGRGAIKQAAKSEPEAGGGFPETLAKIKAFRTKFRSQKPELAQSFAHLDVLEGMIYLQSYEFGNARAARGRISAAQTTLTSKAGLVPRDKLLALSFDSLLNGWEQTYRDLYDEKEPSASVLDRSASDIVDILGKEVPAENDSPEVDAAAGYLALSAGIFWTWVHELYATNCAQGPDNRICTGDIRQKVTNKVYYCNAAKGLHPYLSDTEQATVASVVQHLGDDPLPQRPPSGRLVLLRWQTWFRDQAGPACTMPAPPG